MAANTITVDLLRGSVPAACYEAGALIKAAVVLVDGLTVLPMTIVSIVVEAGDTDEVELSYDDADVPVGIDLSACNLSSFQCDCECCPERTCFEIVGPGNEVVAGAYHVGWVPGDIIVDQIRFYSTTPGDDPLTVVVKANGEVVGEADIVNGSVIDRADFTEAFEDGAFPEDSEITIEIAAEDGSTYTYAGVWRGLTMCLVGFRESKIVVTATFSFVVTTYAELATAPLGSFYFEYPFLYIMTSSGIMQVPLNTTFTPPS